MVLADRPEMAITDGGASFSTDFHDEPPIQAIVTAISDIDGRPVDELPPLYRYVDPDSMNRLMTIARDSNQDVTLRVRVEEYEISIESDGTIAIFDRERGVDSSDSR
ncbi:HalOD1 output domain-containing protein [Halosolutus gelatinilyticus]|uniref:HalOD1 output domain-containing protein n=1 Tax=Halosolutus gelatinilyticus TaxID=2931975 RepID=UPI001FF5AB74|nr:HalOD1 output domain-containing protein [Halosolutus gelatinilyticus]